MAQQRASGTRRVWVPAAFLGAFALVILARLVQLQILEHDAYAAQAEAELHGQEIIYAPRGSILDRNGNVMAVSVDTWDIYVNRHAWEKAEDAKEASEALAPVLKTDPASLRAKVAGLSGFEVAVGRDIEYEAGKALLDKGLPGVNLQYNTARVNPEGDTGASVLGIIGLDNVGLAGIEAAYNETLQGKPGKAIYERDTTGDPIPFGQHLTEEPRPGSDVVLTIDRYLQQLAEKTLADAVQTHRAEGGTVIMMDPATNEILALATLPSLTYSKLDLGDANQLELLKNAAVTDLYEPGSVMKVVTAASAIDAGAVTPNTSYYDSGTADVYGIPIKNWDDRSYGTQSMTGVLVDSINTGAIFMMQAMEKKAPGSFQRYLEAFGFGKQSGIDLQGEGTAIFRRPDDDGYSPVDMATQSFGQSISVTPIQMLAAFSAAINGGKLIQPHLVRAIVGSDGTRTEVQPKVLGQPIRPETSAQVREMLHAVVDSPGRSHPGNPKDYEAGGKSGTANVPVGGSYNDTQIASFIGFAPLEDPQILVMVKLDRNADGKTGAAAASPWVATLLDQSLHYMNVMPDNLEGQVSRR
ncbi:MAG: penicillin-binding protein 2 [Dehalococcoidia bacterium]|nr:penicillin-binding protein 2 [Dehalococcoidia bacterium]